MHSPIPLLNSDVARPQIGPTPEAAQHNGDASKNLVPDYQLLQRIGIGAYGEVWLARNILGQLRAIKIIHRHRFVDPRPFEREFEGIQRFEPISRSHPSQLAILHVGKNDEAGCFYYVMELADDAGSQRIDGVGGQRSGLAARPVRTEAISFATVCVI